MPSTDRRHRYFRNGREITADEALDQYGIMRDGVSLHSPMMFRDSAASYKPGWRVADASLNDEKKAAWLELQDDMQNAWRGTNDARTKKKTTRDPHGRLLSEEVEEEEDGDEDDGRTHHRDHRTLTLDQWRRVHAEATTEALNDYQHELENAWRMNK